MNGIIDTVGSDHVANTLLIKRGQGDIWSARAGFPGIATLLPVLLCKGVNEGRISLERVAEVTSYNAARIFGLYPEEGYHRERVGCGRDNYRFRFIAEGHPRDPSIVLRLLNLQWMGIAGLARVHYRKGSSYHGERTR